MSAHVEAAILRYFRGELSRAADRDALFVHLADCPACREAFDAESAAHQALSGRAFSAVELEAMLPSIVGAPPGRRPAFLAWAAGAAGLVTAVAATMMLVLVRPDVSELQPKGSGAGTVVPLVQVLCFDAAREVTAQRRDSGDCPAPGFLKVVYSGIEPVPVLTVVVLGEDGVRLRAVLQAPTAGTVIPDFAPLGAGDVLRVIAIGAAAETPLDIAKDAMPVLTVKAVP